MAGLEVLDEAAVFLALCCSLKIVEIINNLVLGKEVSCWRPKIF
jgi:hypothetical protein